MADLLGVFKSRVRSYYGRTIHHISSRLRFCNARNSSQALFLPTKFGPFEVGDQETYKPGPGELLVRIEAAALNPIEWKIQTYGSIGPIPASFPAILGSDIAGVVEQVGDGVSRFIKGDRVFYKCA